GETRSRGRIAGEKFMPRASHAEKVELRRRDPAGELEAPRGRARPGDLAPQGGNLVRQGRIAQRRQVQAVAAGVARRDRLAGARSRAGAGERIGAVGLLPRRTGHAASSRAVSCAATTLKSASSTSSTARRSVRAKVARWRSISRKIAL